MRKDGRPKQMIGLECSPCCYIRTQLPSHRALPHSAVAMPRMSPPPPVHDETWRALLAAAAEFSTAELWEFMSDSDLVGLVDPVTGEKRIGSVLGNARQVFAAIFYRRAGVRWVLEMSSGEKDPHTLDATEGMDCLKLEFVPKKELWKEDMARLNAAGFKPAGRGAKWPQARASEPGWHPWHVTQTEAEQLLADLPRLLAFGRLYKTEPELYEGRALEEIPFLPATLPPRLLTLDDLDWRPILLPPEPEKVFRIPPDELEKLLRLPVLPGVQFEFDATVMPGMSLLENGRPCFGRIGLLVESRRGLILSTEIKAGATPAVEAAGRALVKGLLLAGARPERLLIGGMALDPVLRPLCDALKIKLQPASALPALDEAMAALGQRFGGGF